MLGFTCNSQTLKK